jgi:predicted MPP superfamily phosphohydrolase
MHSILTGALSIEQITVAIADLPPSLAGTTLVQLSDFHYDGLRLSDDLLEQAIQASNQAKPDLVLLTGDYVTDDPKPIHRLVPRLKNLQSRAGIYAVLGNHDYYYRHSKAEVTNALSSIGISVLCNQVAYPLGERLALVGIADKWSKEFLPATVMDKLDPNIPRIVLSHNPDTAQILRAWRVDLQLSGHTHGGQIWLPGLGPAVHYMRNLKIILRYIPQPLRRILPFNLGTCLQVVRHWEWAQGLHRVGTNLLYVNRGLGTYLPGRLFCPPEVTVIRLIANC